MKKIIGGKSYDTETAEKVAADNSEYHRGDFHFEHTVLYRTKKGAFFLAGEGGALSRWSQSYGNGQTGGSGMQVLSTEEALAWCEENDADAETIGKFFPVEEG